jgi:hypothetical protein
LDLIRTWAGARASAVHLQSSEARYFSRLLEPGCNVRGVLDAGAAFQGKEAQRLAGETCQKIVKRIQGLRTRRQMVPVFEMEHCLFFPRTKNYLLKIPEIEDKTEQMRFWRLEVLWMAARGLDETMKFIGDFSDCYIHRPRRRCVHLLGLCVVQIAAEAFPLAFSLIHAFDFCGEK